MCLHISRHNRNNPAPNVMNFADTIIFNNFHPTYSHEIIPLSLHNGFYSKDQNILLLPNPPDYSEKPSKYEIIKFLLNHSGEYIEFDTSEGCCWWWWWWNLIICWCVMSSSPCHHWRTVTLAALGPAFTLFYFISSHEPTSSSSSSGLQTRCHRRRTDPFEKVKWKILWKSSCLLWGLRSNMHINMRERAPFSHPSAQDFLGLAMRRRWWWCFSLSLSVHSFNSKRNQQHQQSMNSPELKMTQNNITTSSLPPSDSLNPTD